MGHELTKNDIKKMEEEIEYRIHEVRKAALDDVKETRAQGDLSENFEYHAAKRFKNKNESRIRYLQRTIKNATVIDDSSADDEVVSPSRFSKNLSPSAVYCPQYLERSFLAHVCTTAIDTGIRGTHIRSTIADGTFTNKSTTKSVSGASIA